jgi:hypothetical protein
MEAFYLVNAENLTNWKNRTRDILRIKVKIRKIGQIPGESILLNR